MDNQSKLLLSLLETEQHNLLLIGIDTSFKKENTTIWPRKENLMGRNSNNISDWPENSKSHQIVRVTRAPYIIFYIPQCVFYKLLNKAIQFAVFTSKCSCMTNHMPYPYIWKCSRLFTCRSIFAIYMES